MTSTDSLLERTGHRLVTGPRAALEPAVVEQVHALKRRDPLRPIVILVGGTLLRAYLRRRLAELGGSHINIHVLTASELGLRLGERAMIAAGRTPLPLLADQLLTHEAAQSVSGYFDSVRDRPGFGQALHRTLVELRRAAVEPGALEQAAQTLDETEKIQNLARIAARHRELRSGHYDADDALAAADPAFLGADHLLVYGVWDAPTTLRNAIARIADQRPVTVFVPTTHERADGAHESLRSWFLEELGATTEPIEPPGNSGTALSHVQPRLGAFDTPARGDDTVRIVSAPDPGREVTAALRACLTWAREGIPFHEMAIVYRHADTYRPLVAAAAREAGFPIYDHDGTSLAELAVGRRALALLDLLDGDLDRASVIAFATDSAMPEDTRARYAGSAAQWDRISREAGVVRGREEWVTRLAAHRSRLEQRYADDPPSWLPDRLATIDGLRDFVTDLADRIATRPGESRWSEQTECIRGLFETYLVGAEPIIDALHGLSQLDDLTGVVSSERFDRVARDVIQALGADEAQSGRPGAFRARGINVLDANSLRHLRFRAVCVLGLAERSFPPAPTQDPLLLDEEREALNEGNRWWIPLRARGADPEPLQFALAVGSAEERLLLSYPRTEHGSGRPQYPSSFARAAAEALAGERISADELDDRSDHWFERVSAGRLGASQLDHAINGREYDRTLIERHPGVGIPLLERHEPTAARGRTAWLARAADGPLTPFEGGLTEDVREALAAHPRLRAPMPPSALEMFAKCAMQFFLARVLDLDPLDEPEEIPQLSPLERGSVIHRVLERAMTEWLPADPPSEARRGEHLARLEEIAAEEFSAVEGRGLTGYPQLWALDKQAMLTDLRLWYENEVVDAARKRFDAAAFEVSFGRRLRPGAGPHSTEDPLELDVGGETLRFSGVVDRLEWRESGSDFRVIDYKTGKNKAKKSALFAGGTALQLPLYLRAAADLMLARDWRSGESQYFFNTRRGGFDRITLDGAALEASQDGFERILAGFADAIFSGTFPARPEEWTCKWCAFRSLCPAVPDHIAQMRRKEDDERVTRLADLWEIE